MSDPTRPQLQAAPQAPTLSDRILRAPAGLWRKIKTALNVPTRDAAVQMAAQDQSIAARVEAILAEGEDTVLGRKTPDSVLGAKPKVRRPAADVLYGGGGGVSI